LEAQGIPALQEERSSQLQSISDNMGRVLEQLALATEILRDTVSPGSSVLATNFQRMQMALEEARWAQFLATTTAAVVASDAGDSAAQASGEAALRYWACLNNRYVLQRFYFDSGRSRAVPVSTGRRLQAIVQRRAMGPKVARSRDGVSMRTRALFDR
jgi:hypothetical protein